MRITLPVIHRSAAPSEKALTFARAIIDSAQRSLYGVDAALEAWEGGAALTFWDNSQPTLLVEPSMAIWANDFPTQGALLFRLPSNAYYRTSFTSIAQSQIGVDFTEKKMGTQDYTPIEGIDELGEYASFFDMYLSYDMTQVVHMCNLMPWNSPNVFSSITVPTLEKDNSLAVWHNSTTGIVKVVVKDNTGVMYGHDLTLVSGTLASNPAWQAPVLSMPAPWTAGWGTDVERDIVVFVNDAMFQLWIGLQKNKERFDKFSYGVRPYDTESGFAVENYPDNAVIVFRDLMGSVFLRMILVSSNGIKYVGDIPLTLL